MDAASLDGEELRPILKWCKHRAVCPGHEGLASKIVDEVEERGTAAFVKVRSHLVEEEDRRMACHIGG